MEAGFYTKHPVGYDAYRVPFFRWPKNMPYFMNAGCGANALYILTGRPYPVIMKGNNFRHDYQDRFMVSFLKRNGYKVIPVTKCSMSQLGPDNKIHPDHVLLISQLLFKNEGSWIVTYNGEMMHNSDRVNISPMEFVNRPILSAYVVYHPRWKQDPDITHATEYPRKKSCSSRK